MIGEKICNEIIAQFQEGAQVLYCINKTEFLSRHIVMKLLKTKKGVKTILR